MMGTETAIGRDLRRLLEAGSVAGLTEPQLLERVARRDESAEAAFEAILTRHGPAVLACCRRVLADPAAAEDAFQATFLVLFRRAGSIRVNESLAPWLLHAARMAALKVRRGEIRRAERERRTARAESIAPVDDSSELRLLVSAEVDRLPGKYREPVRLCYFEGRTHDDAAAALGWPVGTVRGRLARARELLRRRLSRRGTGIAPASVAAALAGSAGAARAEVPRSLAETTIAAATRGAPVGAAVHAAAAAVARGLAAGARIKAAAAMLIVSLAVVAAGMDAMVQREDGPAHLQAAPRDQPAARPHFSVDRFGDPLPRGALARLGSIRFGHLGVVEGRVKRIFFAPDGQRLVTVGGSTRDDGQGPGEARVWDVASGHLLYALEADEAALSHDGATLFVAAPGFRAALEFATGRERTREKADPEEYPQLLAASADGTRLAAVVTQYHEKGKVLQKPRSALVIHDAGTLAERRRTAGDYLLTCGLAFSPDGKALALCGPNEDVEPTKRASIATRAGAVWLLDADTGTEHRRLEVEGFNIGSIAFSPDGKTIAAGVGDRTIRLYDSATGQERLPRLGQENAVPPPKKGTGAFIGFKGARAAACLAFSPDGALVASGPQGIGYFGGLTDMPGIDLWDVAAARRIRRLEGHPWGINALAFSPDGTTLASAGGEGIARLWDVATGDERDPRPVQQDRVVALAVSPVDGTIFTAGNGDGIALRWDPRDGRAIERLGVKPDMFESLAVSPDGRTVFIGVPDGPVLWDLENHREAHRLPRGDRSERYFHAAFSPDGRFVTSSSRVWDVATGRRVDAIARQNDYCTAAFTADSRRLIVVDQQATRILDFATGAEVSRPLPAQNLGAINAAISPDGRFVATGSIVKGRRPNPTGEAEDPAITIWELASGREVASLLGHRGVSSALAFSPDGRLLASVGGHFWARADRGLRVWDVATGKPLRWYKNHPGGGLKVAFLPDGRSIVTTGEDHTGLVWDVSDLADRLKPQPLDAKFLEGLWSDLAGDDARRAHRASWALSVAAAVPFLRDRLRPAETAGPATSPEVLRSLRAITALERVGDGPARAVLEDVARGHPDAPATRDAVDSLLRLSLQKIRSPVHAIAR